MLPRPLATSIMAAEVSRTETKKWLATQREGRFNFGGQATNYGVTG